MPSCIFLYADDDSMLFFAAKTAIKLKASLYTDTVSTMFLRECTKISFFWIWAKLNMYWIHGSHQRIKREGNVILSCNGSPLTKSDSFKYLGVMIDKQLSLNNHIEHVVN